MPDTFMSSSGTGAFLSSSGMLLSGGRGPASSGGGAPQGMSGADGSTCFPACWGEGGGSSTYTNREDNGCQKLPRISISDCSDLSSTMELALRAAGLRERSSSNGADQFISVVAPPGAAARSTPLSVPQLRAVSFALPTAPVSSPAHSMSSPCHSDIVETPAHYIRHVDTPFAAFPHSSPTGGCGGIGAISSPRRPFHHNPARHYMIPATQAQAQQDEEPNGAFTPALPQPPQRSTVLRGLREGGCERRAGDHLQRGDQDQVLQTLTNFLSGSNEAGSSNDHLLEDPASLEPDASRQAGSSCSRQTAPISSTTTDTKESSVSRRGATSQLLPTRETSTRGARGASSSADQDSRDSLDHLFRDEFLQAMDHHGASALDGRGVVVGANPQEGIPSSSRKNSKQLHHLACDQANTLDGERPLFGQSQVIPTNLAALTSDQSSTLRRAGRRWVSKESTGLGGAGAGGAGSGSSLSPPQGGGSQGEERGSVERASSPGLGASRRGAGGWSWKRS